MTVNNILEKKDYYLEKKSYFRQITWRHLSNCIRSYEEGEYLSTAIWAAVLVESILKDFLRYFGEKSNRDELDSLIKRVSNHSRELDTSNGNDKINDILRRAEEIRSKRNRLVHDTGVENRGLKTDVDDMCNNVTQIIENYLSVDISREIHLENVSATHEEAPKAEEPDFPVFISTITPHNFEQTEFIEGFCNRLREIGVEPVRCKLTDFDRKDPMNKVKNVMETCNALIVIGLERSHAYYFRDKEGSKNECEAMHRRYSSSWLQLESGMAIGLGKEIFVLCQKDLYSDGIFDRNWNTFVPMEMNMPLNVHDASVNLILEKVKEFKAQYNSRH